MNLEQILEALQDMDDDSAMPTEDNFLRLVIVTKELVKIIKDNL
jgi:hypothetical protein